MKSQILVKKRGDRGLEPYNPQKIKNAISKAFVAVGREIPQEDELNSFVCPIKVEDNISIEEIQNQVEEILMQREYFDVAKKYIIYRENRRAVRENDSRIMKGIKEKLEGKKIANQNANIDEASFGGKAGEAQRLVLKEYALNNCMSKKSKKNHQNNEIYIHDLDSYAVGMHNCLSIRFDQLLRKGFNTRQTDVRPANSINTAFQLIAVIFQVQSLSQFGGVSATHLDWTMVPYFRKSFYKHYKNVIDILPFINKDFNISKEDVENTSIESNLYKGNHWYSFIKKYIYKKALKLTIKETNQAVEGMYHNLNTLQSRSGNQLPFTSINYGTCTLKEGQIVTEALIKGSIKGVGKYHKTSIFPCGIFQCGKGINRQPGDPNYYLFKLALKSTALRLYPNYANIDWSGNKGYDPKNPETIFSTMGCRTANGFDINWENNPEGVAEENKMINPQQKDGRGNLCPVTIILPTLAMEAEKDWDKFYALLDKKISEAKDMLIERYEWICKQPKEAATFIWENNMLIGYDGKDTRSAFQHGTLSLGQIGIAETLQLIFGCDHTTKKGMEYAKKIEELFAKRCKEFKEQYKLNFGVYYTPAENLCYTSLKKFRDKYGIIENVSDKEFFTNSMHVPVWKEIDPFEKIDIESQLTGYSSAGCITYVEMPSTAKHNIKALEEIVNYAMDKDIPYFAINLPNDICLDCGYQDEINDKCPKCGSTHINRLRRVTGYLTGDYKSAFNLGKQQETEKRVKHIKN